EQPEQQGEGGGQHAGGGEGEQERHRELLHEDAGRVGADAEVGGMAERHEAGVADEEIEAGGKERPDDDVVGHERVEARAEGRHEEREQDDEQRPWESSHRSGRPSRPQGRTISTAAMRAKTAKIEKRGKKRMPKESTWPQMSAPREVPEN